MGDNQQDIVEFIFETGILSETPRSGFQVLGSGDQSVSEHINRTTYIGYILSNMTSGADVDHVVKICLFHDIVEARISDLNYIHQKYTDNNETKAIDDIASNLPFGNDIKELFYEYKAQDTLEANCAQDADNLELLVSLKEELDKGNGKAESWIPKVRKRLNTDAAKQLAEGITNTDSDSWWFDRDNDDWWVDKIKET